MAAKFRLYPTEVQAASLDRHAADSRAMWNLCVEQLGHFDRRYGNRRLPTNTERCRQLTEMRSIEWVKQGSATVQQQALRDFDLAVRQWWCGLRRRPKWKKRGRNESFCAGPAARGTFNRKWGWVMIPKCGRVKFRRSQTIPPGLGAARLKRDATGRWFVTFAGAPPRRDRKSTGEVVGVDLGIAVTVALDDGRTFVAPTRPANETELLRRLQRRLIRQEKGTRRAEKTRIRIAAIHAKQHDRLKDWREKLTTDLVRQFDLVVVENLRVKNMLRSAQGRGSKAKTATSRAIADAGWSVFVLRLEQKSKLAGSSVHRVPARNTSIRCSSCGRTDKRGRKSQAMFACIGCGYSDNADTNAAKNIKAAGLAASGRGEHHSSYATPVRSKSFNEAPTSSAMNDPGGQCTRVEVKSCPYAI